jgi:predicted MFS family arabinose efflux permease
VLSAILAYAFFFWVTRQERLGRPCLLPPSLWRNTAFTAICGTVFFTWAAVNACTLTLTLVFQEVQHLSPSETSLRLLPDVGSGILVSILVGYFIDKTSTYWLVVSAAAVTLASPLLMALMDPGWSYWAAAFPAVFLAPISTDVLYTVSNLVITREFPKKAQGLAGAVFNTLVQISTSVGIGLSSLVAAMVMQRAAGGKSIQMIAHDELAVGGGNATEWYTGVELEGYRGSFWTCFGFLAAAVVVAGVWLRDIVDVGKKED